MSKYTYMQKDTGGFYIEFDVKLDGKTHRTGTTWDDYVSGARVLLTDGQVAFRDAHPGASPQEVFDMQLTPVPEPPPPPERTPGDAIREKLMEIDRYDSDVVNQFTIMFGDTAVPCWFDAQQRSVYRNSVDSRRELLEDGMIEDATIELPIEGQIVTLPLDAARIMLNRLQKYADGASNTTYMHRVAVSQLTDIADVDGYDHTVGYPVRLTFNLY